MPFWGALVPLGVMGIRASRKGLLGDRAAGGHQEGPTGLWDGGRNTWLGSCFGTLNLGAAPLRTAWGELGSRAWGGQGVGLAFVLGGMPSVNTHPLVGRPVGDDGAPGVLLVPQPPPATLCCSLDSQPLAQSWEGMRLHNAAHLGASVIFRFKETSVLASLFRVAGNRPRAQKPTRPHWAGSGDWGRARSPVLCQTPTHHCHLQGLLARCSQVLPSAPTKMPEAVTASPHQVQGLLGQTRSCPWSATCVY